MVHVAKLVIVVVGVDNLEGGVGAAQSPQDCASATVNVVGFADIVADHEVIVLNIFVD